MPLLLLRDGKKIESRNRERERDGCWKQMKKEGMERGEGRVFMSNCGDSGEERKVDEGRRRKKKKEQGGSDINCKVLLL